MSEACPFCRGLNFFPYHKKIGIDIEKTIFFEDDNIIITPDISPAGEGHYLIISKEHICNFASSKKLINSLKRAIKLIVCDVYNSDEYVVFEHGANMETSAGNSINHAHVHVIKGKYELINDVMCDNYYEKKYICDIDEFSEKEVKLPYVWIKENGDNSIFFIAKDVPSQYLRLKAMQQKPMPYNYNWRETFDNPNSISLYELNLKMALERIKD